MKEQDKKVELNSMEISEVLRALFNSYHLDFRNYADASLSRRINHLLKIFGLENTEELIHKIQSEEDFKLSLIHEITVGATEFFRDPPFWIAIRDEIFPELSKKDALRIWIAGCSTGEEVFSLSVWLKESGLFEKSRIIATDLDLIKIDIARKGIYQSNYLKTFEDNYLKSGGKKNPGKYFKVKSSGFQLNLDLLDNVIFKHHDLILDEMNEKFDLIFCRNVMIYFNQDLQNNVLNKLKVALMEKGYLGMGVKESISWLEDSRKFKAVKKLEKIYQLKHE